MNKADVIQIHALTSYPGVLLNRDDVGAAKSMHFGDAVRTRVSSQCLKKHWRDAAPFSHLASELGLAHRSTYVYKNMIEADLLAKGFAPDIASSVTATLIKNTVKTQAAKDKTPPPPEGEDGLVQTKTSQLLVLTPAEVELLKDVANEMASNLSSSAAALPEKSRMKKLEKMSDTALKEVLSAREMDLAKALSSRASSLDTALFGRMITSDQLLNVSASVSVAHAITTHAEQTAIDYFTAVDTLVPNDGAAMIGDAELTSGVFYVYATVDMNQLRENLGPAHVHMADDMVKALVRSIATVSPGAKKGSTAPYAYAEVVMLERGSAQPRTLANAFRDAIKATGSDILKKSATNMISYRDNMAAMYGPGANTTITASMFPLTDDQAPSLDAAINTIFAV